MVGLFLSIFSITSCEIDRRSSFEGSEVTVSNTFESTAFTNGDELSIEDLFQVPEGSLFETAEVSRGVEFPSYLIGLYDIDIDRRKIKFEVVAQEGDETYGDLFRVLEAGTTDRYYLTFDQAHNVEDFKSDNSSVSLRVDSDTILVVEIGEGFDFKPGEKFTITFK